MNLEARSLPAANTLRLAILVGLLATAISATFSWVPSIWYDEAATLSAAQRPLGEMWRLLGTIDAVHGFYYFGMHFWLGLVGYTPFTLRFPSAVAVGLAAALVVPLGAQLMSVRAGFYAGLVAAFLPSLTWAGGEGRSYAWTAALATLASLLLVRACRSGRWWWVAYAAASAIAVLMFVDTALVIVAHGVFTTWMAVRKQRVSVIGWWWAAAGAAALVASPVVLASFAQRGQVGWLSGISKATPRQVFEGQWFGMNTVLAVLAWEVAIVAVVLLVRRRTPALVWLTVPWLLIPPVVLLLVTAFGASMYAPRYLTFGAPAVALLIGAGLASIPGRRWGALGVVALMLVSVPSLVDVRQSDAKDGATWDKVAALVQSEQDPQRREVAVYGPLPHHTSTTTRTIAHAYPGAFHHIGDITLDKTATQRGQLWDGWAGVRSRLGKTSTADDVWLIEVWNGRWEVTLQPELDKRGFEQSGDWLLGDMRVMRFSR